MNAAFSGFLFEVIISKRLAYFLVKVYLGSSELVIPERIKGRVLNENAIRLE
jgi:hypothetical protein